MSIKQFQKNISGFSLLEILVAVSVFAVVMTIGLRSVLTVVDANQKTQSLNAVMANLNITLESMTRSLRTGVNYRCGNATTLETEPGDCTGEGWSDRVSFIPQEEIETEFEGGVPTRIEYFLDQETKRIKKDIAVAGTYATDHTTGFMTPSIEELEIEELRFYVMNTTNEEAQPKIIIKIRGYAKIKGRTASTFDIQTLVSQRMPQYELFEQ
jgi:prepilin-type N-terminal cleavage/methylation domain-containing protein